MNTKELAELAQHQFTQRGSLMLLWQDIAEQFYVERANFTVARDMGDHVADWLTTSYPLMVRRDLGSQFGTMLRPVQKEWFSLTVRNEEDEDNESERWLQRATGIQRRAMYDPITQFTRATKEGDHDYAAFGQAAIQITLNSTASALLYRAWHLRDVAWIENDDGVICAIFRKWKPTGRDLMRKFPGKCAKGVEQEVRKDPFCTIECLHMELAEDMCEGDSAGQPFRSIYYDVAHDHLCEDMPIPELSYVIPRWQTVSGSQYAYSPATIIALPDARLLQAMTSTLLEAGEKAANPPMVATQEAIRSDVSLYAGGITWVDAEYDERLGEVLRPITQDKSSIPLGIDMQRDARAMLSAAFFLDKLSLPQRTPEMTAYEVGQRVQEYIRNALPLFEPSEDGYNGGVCERTFNVLMRAGAFGSPMDMPEKLRGADVHFRFMSPLHDAIEERKSQVFMQAKGVLAEAVAIDPSTLPMVDAKAALRDALKGLVPAKWLRSEAMMEEFDRAAAEHAQQQQLLAALQQGADIAKTGSEAQKNMAQVPA